MPYTHIFYKVVFLSVTPLAGDDFTFTQKLTFNASTERQCVQVEILEDAIIESNETIVLFLTSSDPAVKFRGAAHHTTVWIVDGIPHCYQCLSFISYIRRSSDVLLRMLNYVFMFNASLFNVQINESYIFNAVTLM